MGKIANFSMVDVDKITPYENNAKEHTPEQVERIANSIRAFGFLAPCVIDESGKLMAGHGRLMAAKQIGLKQVPCVLATDLTDEERRAYILADNKITELGTWNDDLVQLELSELAGLDFDVNLTGFDFSLNDWFDRDELEYDQRQEGNDEYNEFLDKFEIAKTTDDCYTPQNIYDAVANWVAKEYGLNAKAFCRPFYPGGDYQKEDYTGKVVVDNPPFSILAEIEQWYNENGVKYFLFSPGVTTIPRQPRCCAVCCGAKITYENGACVNTGFVTNLEDNVARTAPDLTAEINEINRENTQTREIPKYEYPPNVVTSSILNYLSTYGQKIILPKESTSKAIGELDSQKAVGKGIYGAGLFISDRCAAELVEKQAAARKLANEKQDEVLVWELSEREREIIKTLK